MDTGNHLVHLHECDKTFHAFEQTCTRCNGEGRIAWKDSTDDWHDCLSEEIMWRVCNANRFGYPIKTQRQINAIGRYVRHVGAKCPDCDGEGVL